jgi:L-iditol 2-dehydrogenase
MVLAGGVAKLPPSVSRRAGALTELLGCCLHGLLEMRVTLGERMLIIGDGPIGLTFLQLAKRMGAAYVATSGRRKRRRALAAELGADEALDAEAADLLDKFGQSLDSVIVAAADVEVTAKAAGILRSGGKLLLFSGYTYGTTMPLDVNALHYRELHIHGSIDCTIRDFRTAAQLLPQLQMEKLITGTFPLENVEEAFRAGKQRDAIKVVIEP